MQIAIMQPTFNPWIGYFDLIDQVDLFVFFDDVQLAKRSWQTRNKIKSGDSELLLSIPIKKNASRDDTLINATEILADGKWQNKHLNAIRHSYRKAQYFESVMSFIENLYQVGNQKLADFNISLIDTICAKIGVNTRLIRSSEIGGIEGNKDNRLKNICLNLGAETYLSPLGSADYIESQTPGGEIVKNGIDLQYHQYKHPTYTQLGNDFISHIGIFDLIFNSGFENALDIIRSGRQQSMHYLKLHEAS